MISALKKTHIYKERLIYMKVCLDAGHFGKYNRSPVLPSYYESDMTWKLHNYLADELKARGIEVVKTRTNQATDRELVSRGYASKGCDLFLSLHSNAASGSSAAYAVCIYMRDNASQTYDDKSKDIANKLVKTVAQTMGVGYKTYCKEYVGDRDGNGKQDDEWYGVLQGAKQAGVPGVIVEHGFHTNLKDAQWLSDDSNLKKMAAAEAETIAKWLGVNTTPSAPTQDISTAAAGKYTGAYTKSVSGSGYSAYGPASSLSGVWKTTDELNVRDKADPTSKILVTIKKGSTVRSWGYYSYYNGTRWFCIECVANKVKYTGYVNANYLTKV